jgi:hypothetical protein
MKNPLEAYLSQLDMPTREAITRAMQAQQAQIDQLKEAFDQFYRATNDKVHLIDRDVAAFKAEVEQALDIDPRQLSRAQIARLARKLEL